MSDENPPLLQIIGDFGQELLRFEENGKIFVRGELVTFNQQVVDGMVELITGRDNRVMALERELDRNFRAEIQAKAQVQYLKCALKDIVEISQLKEPVPLNALYQIKTRAEVALGAVEKEVVI